jgi:predicted peptidase
MVKEGSFGKFKYLLYEPSHLNNLENLPLIVVMHGSGEIGSSLSKLKAREPYISLNNGKFKADAYILMPQLPKDTWKSYAAELIKLINEIVITYKCDLKRVSLTGHSLGAMGVIEILEKYPDLFSAGASLSCAHDYTDKIKNISHIPIWFLYGEKESNYGKYARKMYEIAIKENSDSKINAIPGYGHPIQPFWCNEKYGIFKWLTSFSIGQYPTWQDWLNSYYLLDGRGMATDEVDKPIPNDIARKLGLKRG